MIKELLKEKEPIAYLSLGNDLRNEKVAHSYLFYGELNPLKTEAAFLLAESIIEGNNNFADENSDLSKRIKNGNYFDVIYIDGYKETIKKENIDYIMDEFSRTSLEESGKKIYIISNINNSSIKVLNMILKFMEEPTNEETYAILISDNIDSLLPTIVSRCQKIEFKTRDYSNLIKDYMAVGFDEIDAYILSNIEHQFNKDIELNDENYLLAKEYVYKTIDNLDNKNYLPVMFYNEFYNAVSKDSFKTLSNNYLNIMMLMLDDASSLASTNDNEYNRYLNILNSHDISKLLAIFIRAIDKCKVPVNRQLLFDQIASEIIL